MVSWHEIETVLLDMDGTLLDLHYDNYFWLHLVPERFGVLNGLTFEQAQAEIMPRIEAKKGCIEWYCLDFWSDQLQLDIAALKREVKHKIAVRPRVVPFLQALRKSRKQVILLTNAHRDSLDLKMAETGIAEHFDALVSTHDYGQPKEQQALWHALVEDHPFVPKNTLLVDDTASVLDAASAFGIGHVLTMMQPDSKKPVREHLNHPAILHFDEVLPIV